MLHNTTILQGEVSLPGDKSIAHRAILLASLINGRTKIGNLSDSEDIAATINVLSQCGIKSNLTSNEIEIFGRTFIEPSNILDCHGSGTTARLISGKSSSNFMPVANPIIPAPMITMSYLVDDTGYLFPIKPKRYKELS